FDETAEAPGDLAFDGVRVGRWFGGETGGEGDAIDDAGLVDNGRKRYDGVGGGHVRIDAGDLSHDLGHRPVRDALTVREAASAHDACSIESDDGRELADEPAFANSRDADEREEDGLALSHRAPLGTEQQGQLVVA